MKHLAIAAACAAFVAQPADAATTVVEFPLSTTIFYQFTFSKPVTAEINVMVSGLRVFEEYGGNVSSVETDFYATYKVDNRRLFLTAFPGRQVREFPGEGILYNGYTRLEYSVSGTTLEPVLTLNRAFGVPEPATWALMILGFGATGAALRRRRAPRPARA